MKVKTLLLGAAIAISGCATAPQAPEPMSVSDYGSPISQSDAESKAESVISPLLKDPYSAMYTWQPIETGWISEARIRGGRKHYGYVLNGTVNAKNSYGAYIGTRKVSVLFKDGHIAMGMWEQPIGIGGSGTYMAPLPM